MAVLSTGAVRVRDVSTGSASNLPADKRVRISYLVRPARAAYDLPSLDPCAWECTAAQFAAHLAESAGSARVWYMLHEPIGFYLATTLA